MANTTTPTPTPSLSTISTGDYWSLVNQAEEAYNQASFADAMSIARQAIAINPDENTAWDIYTQASIADAGNTYLEEIPDHRYRYPVTNFIQDQVNQSRDWFVIDVREPDEFAAGHIDRAINIPFREFLQHLNEIPSSKTAPILIYCHSQKRATHVLVILHELGYLKVFNLEGGYDAYTNWMNTNILPTPGPTPTPGPDEPDFGC
ncbi:rhodanese-like domain-containing protein [bacterium]|nr:rhodanese-like domain-containing protein [bacterium]